MNKLSYLLLIVLIPFCSFSQEEIVHSVYFDFDKYNLKPTQKESMFKFIQELDSSMIESISIYGYTDDRGRDEYKYTLSTNRANTI